MGQQEKEELYHETKDFIYRGINFFANLQNFENLSDEQKTETIKEMLRLNKASDKIFYTNKL